MARRGDEQEAGAEGGEDLYAVLGLKKECSSADLRDAYKKLALRGRQRWHPDRCSAAGSASSAEEATSRFQAIQEAYSVLSDESKRTLYDVGWLHEDDDAEEMCDFLGEMAAMMNQTSPTEGGGESFEELQRLFFDMFQSDVKPSNEAPTNPTFPPSRDQMYAGFDCSASSSGIGAGDGAGYKPNGAEISDDGMAGLFFSVGMSSSSLPLFPSAGFDGRKNFP